MLRLSRPVEDIGQAYDIVVVGSGYGGAVAASRLARHGRRVCVLERGREIRPEQRGFPDDMIEAAAEAQMRLPDGGRAGNATGLYDLRLGDDMNVMVACGLGGTSLINANVAAKPDRRLFDDPRWPQALRADVDGGLESGYAKAAATLGATAYAGPALAKLSALESAAAKVGGTFHRPAVTVNFTAGRNAAGVDQAACTLCGDCCSGCNVGAKNSTLMNYLPDAVAHGAAIFTEAEVLRVGRQGDKWQVFYRRTGCAGDELRGEEKWVEADVVVLGAGALGSTEILLRSRAHGLPLSERLGRGFTGNGDVLAFAYNNDAAVNGIGRGKHAGQHPPVGPCIAGMIDRRDGRPLEEGMVIEEGSLPSALAPILPAAFAAGGAAFGTDTDRGDWGKERLRELESLTLGAYRGAVANTQTLLVMSQDDGGGSLVLDDDRLRVVWPGVGEQPVFQRVDKVLRDVTAATGGTLVENPLWSELLGRHLITVHPLGGCGMGDTAGQGVVDERCRVFAGASGIEVHEGLYVCDGAVMPRPLGVNPLWTISALTERAMDKLIAEKGWAETPATGVPPARPMPVGLKFSERMSGWVSAGADFEAGERAGRDAGSRFSLTATVIMDDIDTFLARKEHVARLSGTVEAPGLAAGTLLATGTFNLFRDDQADVETKRLEYDMQLVAPSGARFRCFGFKAVHHREPFEMWSDTTTLFVTVTDTDANAEIARGVLHLSIADFMRELRTIQPINAPTTEAGLRAVTRFAEFFGLSLWDSFGGAFLPDALYDPAAVRPRRELRLCPPEIHSVDTKDGKRLLLTRYNGGNRGVVLMIPGLGVSSRIYAIDSVDTNMAEFLYGNGYDLWLFDWRASIELPYTRESWTGDDAALYDYPAAVDLVRRITGKPIDVMAHCVGAITFTLALLRGTVAVRSMVVSQVALNPIVPVWPTRVLAYLGLPSLLRMMGVQGYEVRAKVDRPLWEAALDKSLRLLPFLGRGEQARSATHRRVTAVYGPLYELDRLNQATMDALPEVFGMCNSRCLEHMTVMATAGHVVPLVDDFDYMAHLRRLAFPITFVHGDHNRCFIPEGTQRTVAALSAANGAAFYDRHLIKGYGHIDCMFGKDAVRDVYPIILRHLEKVGTP